MEKQFLLSESLKKFYEKDKADNIIDSPPTFSERGFISGSDINKKFIFVSYSHYDFEAVYADLRKLWSLNANYWYDKEFVFSDKSDDWDLMANSVIMDKDCVGVLFYVSTHAFLSQAIYQEVLACKKRLENDENFRYKLVLLEGNSIIDIQNNCKLPQSFTSQRLIDIHSIWGTEKLFLHYSYSGEHFFRLVEWFNKMRCLDDINYASGDFVAVRKDYLLFGTSLISYFGNGREMELAEEDKITVISTKSIASPTIEKIVIPEGVIEIDNFAIVACPNLKTIVIPSTVEKMEFFALANFSFNEIIISKENKNFKTDENGFVYQVVDGMATVLFTAPNKRKVRILNIEDSVSSINDYVISYCDYLEEIVFPRQLRRIGYWSVKGNKKLKKITLYPNVEYISPYAFIDTNIEEVIFCGSEEKWKNTRINENDTFESMFNGAKVVFVN